MDGGSDFSQKEDSKDYLKLFFGLFLGFSIFSISSNRKSPIQKLSRRKIKNVAYFPNIKIQGKNGHYHIHHWLVFVAIYAPVLMLKRGFMKSKFLNGFFVGSILQGLTFSDRFKIKYHKEIEP